MMELLPCERLAENVAEWDDAIKFFHKTMHRLAWGNMTIAEVSGFDK